MSLSDVLLGEQTWNDYVNNRDLATGFERALAKSSSSRTIAIQLGGTTYQSALEAGLGSLPDRVEVGLSTLGAEIHSSMRDIGHTLEFGLDQLSEGIDQLNADFHILMGDVVWKLENQHSTLKSILKTLQAPLDTAAKELRRRAEDAYQNGWYEEALNDFLESERRNYQDFAVHRSIANIYCYHIPDLEKALTYFRKAAKYARPRDVRQAAEAHYFAAIMCGAQQRLREGLEHLGEAVRLNPTFYESWYVYAAFAALLDERASALRSLEAAVHGDPRYYERAKGDPTFDRIRGDVDNLLARLATSIQREVLESHFTLESKQAEYRDNYVILSRDAERRLSTIIVSEIIEYPKEQIAEATTSKTYKEWVDLRARQQGRMECVHDLLGMYCFLKDLGDGGGRIAFSPDGALLASKDHVWEIPSGRTKSAAWVREIGNWRYVRTEFGGVFSPDGAVLARMSPHEPYPHGYPADYPDDYIELWEVASARLVRRIFNGLITAKHRGKRVSSLAFSPDGAVLAAAGTTIGLWDVATGREIRALSGHEYVWSIAFSPDGVLLASVGVDHTIELWDVATGRKILTLGHDDEVQSVAFSPDGSLLASGSSDTTIGVWELPSGRQMRVMTGHTGGVTSVAFRSDGVLLASGGVDHTIRLWDVATGREIQTLTAADRAGGVVTFSPDGCFLASGHSGTVLLWVSAMLTKRKYSELKTKQENWERQMAEERAALDGTAE